MSLPTMQVPSFEVTVPSTNKKIKLRPFLVKEHKSMLMMDSSTSDEVVEILKGLIYACSFEKLNVEKLTDFDMIYLFLKLRERSIGANVDLIVTCECGHKNDAAIDLKNVEVQRTAEHTNKFDLGKSVTGEMVGVTMKYPKLEEVIALYDNPTADRAFDLTKKCVETVYTDTELTDIADTTDEEFKVWFESLSKEQLSKIENFFVTMPRVVQKVDITCDACGTDIHHKIEGIENFFV